MTLITAWTSYPASVPLRQALRFYTLRIKFQVFVKSRDESHITSLRKPRIQVGRLCTSWFDVYGCSGLLVEISLEPVVHIT